MSTFVRLVSMEARKIVTTRSSRLFLVLVALLGGTVSAAAAAWAPSAAVEVSAALIPLGILFALALPVVGILVMTSDWQTRDVMGLFLAQPRRGRTFAAKIVAALLSTVVLLAGAVSVAIGIAALVALATRRSLVWSGVDEGLTVLSVAAVLGTCLGVALGAAVQNATGAIALSFLQVLVVDPLVGFLPNGVGPFLQSNSISALLLEGGSLLPALSGFVLWLLVPGGIGWWRHLTREVS